MEGAREVTMHWAAHVPRPKQNGNVQDFRKINRMAAKNNVANAKELIQFKQGVDVKLLPPQPLGAQPKVIPSDVIPSFAYGRKSRPSTPISAVVGYQYAAEYEEALANDYDRYEYGASMANSKSKIRLTKASKGQIAHAKALRASHDHHEYQEPFKLSKFKKVPSRLQLLSLDAQPMRSLQNSQSMPSLQNKCC